MSSLTSDVVVLCWDAPTSADRNAHKIAEFLGADVRFVTLTPTALDEGASIQALVPRCSCLIVAAETLANVSTKIQEGLSGICALSDVAEHVLTYGFQAASAHNEVLRVLSAGALLAVHPLSDTEAKFEVSEDREWCAQFSGLSLGLVDPKREKTFLEGTGDLGQSVMIRAAKRPFFVRLGSNVSSKFFIACDELANLDEKVPQGTGLLSWFSRLIPLMMFLRGALGKRVWHNDDPRACLILDDPLLRKRYGFLDYARLFESMRRERFSICVAFIPWNYRRSSADVTKLFQANSATSSLCVHGCDHTAGEFAATDTESMRGKATLALERMRMHQRLSGVSFDEVMVFPQGLFSPEALLGLKSSGYLAAVNTAICPSTMPGSLVLRDVLQVAVTRFSDFPLFGRRYPKEPAEFAFDLFLGKPALAVEHHGYFRNGYESLERFAAQLNTIEPRMEWANLGTICARASLARVVRKNEIQVQFYTSRFCLTNRGTETMGYSLLGPRTSESSFLTVTVDGCVLDREQQGLGNFEKRLALHPGQTASIRIAPYAGLSSTPMRKPTAIHNSRVLIRRMLCEFRDNYVETNRPAGRVLSRARDFRLRRKAARAAAVYRTETDRN